jgi:transposase
MLSPRPRFCQIALGEALAYIAKCRDGPGRFLTDGRVEIDSNTVERTIRPLALNRKNALFTGHDAGAANWAVIATLIGTCKMKAIDQHAWLTRTPSVIVSGHKQSQINDLLPWQLRRQGGLRTTL